MIVDTPPLAVVPDAFPCCAEPTGFLSSVVWVAKAETWQPGSEYARERECSGNRSGGERLRRPRAGSPGGYAYVYGYDDSPSKDDRATGASVASNGSPAAAQSAAGDPAGRS